MEMAKIGATEKGGVCRLTLTDFDRDSRELFTRWCQAAGCTVTVDRVGNMFARRSGRDPNRKPVMAGSHLDSQPTGGKFDGAYGVMAALEVIRTLNDAGIETEAPIEVAMWTNEEGSRFAPAMMGSGVFAGVFTVNDVHAKTDIEGLTFGDELRRIGYEGQETPGDHPTDSYFECHIEQGPVLENDGLPVGVVISANGQRWYEVTVKGVESHAGPTPMETRKDALVGAARIVHLVNEIGHTYQPNACATVGMMKIHPNSRNVIPGEVWLTIDFRHPDNATLSKMDSDLKRSASQICKTAGLTLTVHDLWYSPPIPFDRGCVAAVRRAAEAHGYGHRDIVSGAGHDAVYMTKKCPTAMIFVPCEDGISHNEAENASKEDLAAGCDVLLHAILERAELHDPNTLMK